MYQRVDLGDRISVEPAAETTVAGFPEDTIVRARRWTSLERAARLAASGSRSTLRSRPGSAVAAPTRRPRCGSPTSSSTPRRTAEELHELAARVGADVPFFLRDGPQLGTGDGTALEPLELPQDFVVLLLLPEGELEAVDRGGLCGVRRAWG